GTWYKAESATFTNGNQPIITRVDSPFTSAQFGYNFQPGGYVNYDEVCLQDGHVWVGYNWNGYRYYLPIRT
ncbi:autolysin, partial [Staphylococcus gallinarum]